MLGKQSQGLIWEDLIWQKPVSIHYLWLSLCFETVHSINKHVLLKWELKGKSLLLQNVSVH